jgi:hypothetical protein
MPSSLAKARRRTALDDLIAKQAPQQEPEPRIQDARRGAKGGRPRLDAQEDFVEGFCQLLPRLSDGSMSKTEAARRLGISHRSVSRYMRTVAERLAHVPRTR